LTTCPNIRELGLTIGWSGCEAGAGQPFSFDFSSNRNARFPPLEVLKLNGYDLESTKNKEWVKMPEYQNTFSEDETEGYDEYLGQLSLIKIEQESKKSHRMNIEQWLDAMGWCKIHTLHLSDTSPKVLQLLSGSVLPSLKHLSLSGTYRDQPKETVAYEDFLNSITFPLESITFRNLPHLSPDNLINIITTHHSPALKNQKLTGLSSKLTPFQITRLHSAPYLETLDIDISRPFSPDINTHDAPQWANALLSSLGAHLSLRHLTPRFPSAITDPDEYCRWADRPRAKDFHGYGGRTDGIEDSVVNHTSVLELFRLLRGQKPLLRDSAGSRSANPQLVLRLEALEVFVGDYEGGDQFGMVAERWCVLGRYVCRVDKVGGVSCEGETRQNAYYD
jgi:hypothetical protein